MRRGRPPLPTEKKRTVRIPAVRMTETEAVRVVSLAKRLGVSLTAAARMILMGVAA